MEIKDIIKDQLAKANQVLETPEEIEAKLFRDKHVMETSPDLNQKEAAMFAGVSKVNYAKLKDQMTEPSITPDSKPDFELVWAKALRDYELEDKEWLIDKLVPANSVGVWTGKRGSMKTWLVLNAMFSLAKGEEFLGKYPTKKGKVIYLDKENGLVIMKKRAAMIEKGLEIDKEDDTKIGFICFSTLKIDKFNDIQKIKEVIEEHQPSLLVVDTYRRAISFEENSAGDVSELFVDTLRPLAEQNDMSILLIHHDRKGESHGDEMDMIRGSSDLANYADFILKNERKGKDVILKQLKNRNAPEETPIKVSIDTDEVSYIKFKCEGEYELQTEDQKCAEILMLWIIKDSKSSFKTGEAREEATNRGIKRNNIFNGLRLLEDRGMIIKEGYANYKVVGDNSKLIV